MALPLQGVQGFQLQGLLPPHLLPCAHANFVNYDPFVSVPFQLAAFSHSPVPYPRMPAVQLLQFAPSLAPLPGPVRQQLAPEFAAVPKVATSSPSLESNSISNLDLKPWLDAAHSFAMNTDFDISSALHGRRLDLPTVVQVMKEQSANKWTIQALADKLVLHKMLTNLGIPQLPALLAVEGRPSRQQVTSFVLEHLCHSGMPEVVAKPTHQSNATGVLSLSQLQPHEIGTCIEYLLSHIREHSAQKAGDHESAALQSLKPGFIAQPKYKSVVGIEVPLELRVVTLWGKARTAVWWCGRAGQTVHHRRTVWLVRHPVASGELSKEDGWDIVHQHVGQNRGFDKAVELFKRNIAGAVNMAEKIAVAFGAPFLRADFFVGSEKWGLRLNEVAYGCGCDYRTFADDGSGRLLDDGAVIAQILHDGMAHCKKRLPPQHFLAAVGVRGCSYIDSIVTSVPPGRRLRLPGDFDGTLCRDCAVPEALCATQRHVHDDRSFRSRSFHASSAEDQLRLRQAVALPRSRTFVG